MPSSGQFRFVFFTALISMLVGALYARYGHAQAEGVGEAQAWLRGALIGGSIGGVLSGSEALVVRGALGPSIGRMPFLIYFGLRSIDYLCVILFLPFCVFWLLPNAFGDIPVITLTDIGFSFAMSLIFNLQVAVNDLLGPGVLYAFAAGRYYRPRIEQRVLLFIDMRSSTAIAERLEKSATWIFLTGL